MKRKTTALSGRLAGTILRRVLHRPSTLGFLVLAMPAFGQGEFTAVVEAPGEQAMALVQAEDVWQYRKGTSAPEAGWQTVADAALGEGWESGAGAFGYADDPAETAGCATLLPDMRNGYPTSCIPRCDPWAYAVSSVPTGSRVLVNCRVPRQATVSPLTHAPAAPGPLRFAKRLRLKRFDGSSWALPSCAIAGVCVNSED